MPELNTHTIRVVVVDDQPLERMGNSLILDSDDGITVVGEAGSGVEAVEVIDQTRPDVVLMDVRMPGMNGIEATRIIAEQYPVTRVIVLTTFDLDEYAFGSLAAGASAFLLKSATPAALVDAVKVVSSGAAVAAPRLTAQLIEHYLRQTEEGQLRDAGARDRSSANDPLAALSPRERDIFAAIVRGLTNTEISAELMLAPSTIKSHINSIFAKLDLRDRVHAVILGFELGMGTAPGG